MDARPEEKTSGERGEPFDLLTVLGHDLKSPLNAVESYLKIMSTGMLGDKLDPYLPIVESSIARLHQMRELITDVIDWSRIQTPLSRTLVALDVSKAAHVALNRCREEAEKSGITLSSHIQESLTMKAATGEIDLVLHHLISNAVRYNREGGKIDFTMKKSGPQIVLSVSDTGIGMNGDEQARIFQEFVRIKNRKTQGVRGTGLGLAIVRKLVDLYRGTVSVQSEEYKGTTFSLTLSCGD